MIYFALFREMAGLSEEEFHLQEGSTVEALVEAIKVQHGPLGGVERILVAVNGEFAEPGETLVEGDVAALFPPVSGG